MLEYLSLSFSIAWVKPGGLAFAIELCGIILLFTDVIVPSYLIELRRDWPVLIWRLKCVLRFYSNCYTLLLLSSTDIVLELISTGIV